MDRLRQKLVMKQIRRLMTDGTKLFMCRQKRLHLACKGKIMIKKDIEVDGKMIPFRASATVPRLYRATFHRDIFKDLSRLKESVDQSDKEESGLEIEDLELFENVAYIMAKHADPSQPDTPEEWLEQFNVFSIYSVLPQLLELWGLNMKQDSEAKKNKSRQVGK
nr:MAG TPA: tail assembly chaperone protein [Caudoviricetes sp.]